MIYITEIVENCSFWIFGDLLEKLRRKLSDFSGISHLLWFNLQFLIIARAPSTLWRKVLPFQAQMGENNMAYE